MLDFLSGGLDVGSKMTNYSMMMIIIAYYEL